MNKTNEEFIKPRDVAIMFGVTYRTVYRWTRKGLLPYTVNPSGKFVYRKQAIEELIVSGEKGKKHE